MTDDNFRKTLQVATRSTGGVAVAQTQLQQVIAVISDLGAENIRLINEVRQIRNWLCPSVVASALLAVAVCGGAYTMKELATEQRLTRQANAVAQETREARQRESQAIQAAVQRAETAAKAAQGAAKAAQAARPDYSSAKEVLEGP